MLVWTARRQSWTHCALPRPGPGSLRPATTGRIIPSPRQHQKALAGPTISKGEHNLAHSDVGHLSLSGTEMAWAAGALRPDAAGSWRTREGSGT